MAKRSSSTKFLGLLVLAAGVGLSLWGYQMSGSAASQLTQAVTGGYTDKVMGLYIGGGAAIIAGLYLFSRK